MIISKNNNGEFFCDGQPINEAEYNDILEIIHNRPTAPDGYGYRLTADLVWELYELPQEEFEEAGAEDDENVLTQEE